MPGNFGIVSQFLLLIHKEECRGDKCAVVTYFGDSAISNGDFQKGFNLAGSILRVAAPGFTVTLAMLVDHFLLSVERIRGALDELMKS
jgi:hypothetical protein